MTSNISAENTVYSVQELNNHAKDLLETTFLSVGVEGEISNLSKPRSGHWYLTLKDNQAQIRAAMFKFRNQRCTVKPNDGDKVIAFGKVSLYTARGDYQLIIDRLEPAGLGDLQRAYDALKNKLTQLGWFDEATKKPLPNYPTGIAVVTSATGAALRDILAVLKRRAPSIPVRIFPSQVQGAAATSQLIKQLYAANEDPETNVIILARGGGSIEDLWCFNDEKVAEAIKALSKPLISGVGHQTDFTIADFVADVRAATPTAAAELVSFDQGALLEQCHLFEKRLLQLIQYQLERLAHQVQLATSQLKRPDQKIEEWLQKLDTLDARLLTSIQHQLQTTEHRIEHLNQRLLSTSPKMQCQQNNQTVTALMIRLKQALQNQLQTAQHQSQQLTTKLNTLSPLNTLSRGYSITQNAKGQILTDAVGINAGDNINITLHKGSIEAQVLGINGS